MQRVEWGSEFEIGINVIDAQHRRIIDYINELCDLGDSPDRQRVAALLTALVDYTMSHFAFEEALMEEAGYRFLAVHQQTHEAFTRRIEDLHGRFGKGQDVSTELGDLLQTWLIEHIQSDDQSYAPQVRTQFADIRQRSNGKWLINNVKRFFAGG